MPRSLLLSCEGVGKAHGPRSLFDELSFGLFEGDQVGLVGPNGAGKSTLLRILAGIEPPDRGQRSLRTGVRVGYVPQVRFEQQRPGLDPSLSLRRALAPEGDTVSFQGRSLHVAAWAKRFLFQPEQLEVPVGRLSGGEEARIHIARLMREPADLLILDEPTNDLDIPTLDVLEESLTTFEGGLVLVTHDRFMLDRVATGIVALDGRGGAETFADYAQWELARATSRRNAGPPLTLPSPQRGEGERPRARSKRLGYLEQRELDAMQAAIVEAETAREMCRRAAEDPGIASDPAGLQARYAALEDARAEVDRLYARWAELDAKGETR